jgi:hypothetical protein
MTDPLSLAALGAAALTEGIKFLYGQAVELLKRRREKKTTSERETPKEITLPAAAFQGSLRPVVVNADVLERIEGDMKELAKGLSPYASDLEEADPGNHSVLEQLDALRLAIEAVYGQRISFIGENRGPSGGTVVIGEVEVGRVQGRIAAVRARQIAGGNVRGEAKAEVVEQGGELYGIDADRIE